MKKTTLRIGIGALALVGIAGLIFYGKPEAQAPQGGGRRGGDGSGKTTPVMVAAAKRGDIDVVINALGTVTARTTTTVKPRVDGLLIRVSFREGQTVRAGDLLAEIDPRPFQVQLDQATGQLIKDEALLANARLDLARYRGLLAKDSIATQQVDAQAALVQQNEGTVKTDRAQVDNAKLQLSFTRITAPVAGRLGLRQVDVGNVVRASDANGLVVITQTQPITAIFAIPSDNLTAVIERLNAGDKLAATAYDRDGRKKLATGQLMTVDNQIDVTTGTVKLKAEFANTDNALFPNQFVNVQLRVETRHDAILVPTAAIQRGTVGTYFYVVGADQTAAIRPVTLGAVSGDTVAVVKGLQAGEQVVIDGADKLRQGAKVEVATAAGEPARAARGDGSGAPGGRGKHRRDQGGGAAPAEGSKAAPTASRDG